ncbi:hypothetical protein [Candidatus Galacturonibacter soehngenii]|uniref:GOLD domain-containing protein n=1 Tax=Candidatus Galacturonatibacter soehngenii TaxID=2307010 RepID=A0A7V7QMQ5_9FIRM|nr:hypothetical protein [Candidatus Galacturonibacter soehngenii]KAB1440022.1 hypothetical protein F7O84_06485 [Candidatus Galacturonibacter soehngenii]
MNKKTLFYTFIMTFVIFFTPIQALATTTNMRAKSNDDIISVQSADTSIVWKLASNDSKTRKIYLSKDQTITVSCTVTSSTAMSRIGIIDLEDTYHVKSIRGGGYCSFTAPSSGTYKIYVKNTSSISLTAVVNYAIE